MRWLFKNGTYVLEPDEQSLNQIKAVVDCLGIDIDTVREVTLERRTTGVSLNIEYVRTNPWDL